MTVGQRLRFKQAAKAMAAMDDEADGEEEEEIATLVPQMPMEPMGSYGDTFHSNIGTSTMYDHLIHLDVSTGDWMPK